MLDKFFQILNVRMEMLDVPPLYEGKIGNGFSFILDIQTFIFNIFQKC